MKKLNITLGVGVLCFSLVIFSSFTSLNNLKSSTESVENCIDLNQVEATNSNQGNGNIVTIDNGQTWYWQADNCDAPLVVATSTRVQSATNGFFSADVSFQLPEGHCDIPAKGAKVTHYDENSWSIVNSNGKVTGKVLFRPSDN